MTKQVEQVIEEARELFVEMKALRESYKGMAPQNYLGLESDFSDFCYDNMPQILDALGKYKDSMNFYMSELGKLQRQNQIMREALKLISGMCGNPNPVDACRLICDEAQEAIKKVSEV